MVRIAVLLVIILSLAVALLTLDRNEIAHFLAGGPEPAPSSSPEPAPSPAATERKVTVESDLYSFDYAYPAQAAAIPALRDLLEARIAEDRARVEAEAKESRKDAKDSGYPFQPHYFDLGWDVSADLPGWLALGAGVQTYGGGAHPNHGFDSLVWDKQAGRALEPLDLFVSAEALDGAVHQRYCDALDKERAERREESVEQIRRDEIWPCPGVTDLTIILQAKGGKGFDHLLLLAAPYVAGPYVEGSYESEVAVDQAVRDAVRPEFREAFRAAR